MEELPKAPTWKMQDVSIEGYETTKPVVIFYQDPLECIQALLRNPIFEGSGILPLDKSMRTLPDRIDSMVNG